MNSRIRPVEVAVGCGVLALGVAGCGGSSAKPRGERTGADAVGELRRHVHDRAADAGGRLREPVKAIPERGGQVAVRGSGADAGIAG